MNDEDEKFSRRAGDVFKLLVKHNCCVGLTHMQLFRLYEDLKSCVQGFAWCDMIDTLNEKYGPKKEWREHPGHLEINPGHGE